MWRCRGSLLSGRQTACPLCCPVRLRAEVSSWGQDVPRCAHCGMSRKHSGKARVGVVRVGLRREEVLQYLKGVAACCPQSVACVFSRGGGGVLP